MNYFELLKLAAPEVIVTLTALAVLAIDLTSMRGLDSRLRMTIGGLVASAGCGAALLWLLVNRSRPTH